MGPITAIKQPAPRGVKVHNDSFHSALFFVFRTTKKLNFVWSNKCLTFSSYPGTEGESNDRRTPPFPGRFNHFNKMSMKNCEEMYKSTKSLTRRV